MGSAKASTVGELGDGRGHQRQWGLLLRGQACSLILKWGFLLPTLLSSSSSVVLVRRTGVREDIRDAGAFAYD